MTMNERLNRVVSNYEARLRSGANGRLSESQIRGQVEHYGVAAAMDDMVLDQVRMVLNWNGVATISFAFYHAFSRELAKLQRQDISHEWMEREMATMVAKWAGRGLSQKVLLDIALNVFNMAPPKPPSEQSAG
jgi:hypothetical protein